MDVYQTVIDFAGILPPSNMTFDGRSIKEALLNPTLPEQKRTVFYYRGDTLMKIRFGEYKAHYMIGAHQGSLRKR